MPTRYTDANAIRNSMATIVLWGTVPMETTLWLTAKSTKYNSWHVFTTYLPIYEQLGHSCWLTRYKFGLTLTRNCHNFNQDFYPRYKLGLILTRNCHNLTRIFTQGYNSKNILASYSADQVRDAILQIPIITDVEVAFSIPTEPVCQVRPNVVKITFINQFGSLPPLVAVADANINKDKGKITVYADGVLSVVDTLGQTFSSIKGSKEGEPCANRGMCATNDGMCYCFSSNGDTYASSNGYGAAGTRGDCGFIASGKTVASCPGDTPCSGHGVCDSESGSGRI